MRQLPPPDPGADSRWRRHADARLAELRAEKARIGRGLRTTGGRERSPGNRAPQERGPLPRGLRPEVHTIALADVVRAYQPNAMGWFCQGAGTTSRKVWELLWDEPRESNTEGGLFPAIFGTVMLVFLMAIVCFPLGVLAGIYLGEYAREGVAGPPGADRREQPGRHSFDCLRDLRAGLLRLRRGRPDRPLVLSRARRGGNPDLRHRRHPLGKPDARPA